MLIVVSRYNENIEWTKQFSNVLIYNKGPPLQEYNVINLNNVGREGHTYYKFICDNYDNLDDYIVFLQGNPFDHSPDIINNLRELSSNPNISLNFQHLSNKIYDCNLSGCSHHSGIPLQDVYKKVFGLYKTDLEFKFGAGAQFIVSKQQILKRSKEFYENIVHLLSYSINPIEGFVIERFHSLIFS